MENPSKMDDLGNPHLPTSFDKTISSERSCPKCHHIQTLATGLGGSITKEQEWTSVARSSSYFGPTLPIFRFLDKDDEGTISFEEFEEQLGVVYFCFFCGEH